MKHLNPWKIVLFILIIFTFSYSTVLGRNKKNNNSITIQFRHYVGDILLTLDSLKYKNNIGQPYSVSKFKYYISNVSLKTKDNSEIQLPGQFLINEEEENSKEIKLQNVPDKYYTSISFIIGVDSVHNCSGIQSGDLDPVKGMFWAWNTGYIFLKLEGKSPESNIRDHTFEYHIGGFMEPNNCIRRVTLTLNNHSSLHDALKNEIITIKADISEILKKPVDIDFQEIPIVTDFNNAKRIADNYQDMFSIIEAP